MNPFRLTRHSTKSSAGQSIGNFHYNRLGGTFRGPVILPKVYTLRLQF
jgi:hypothetical protein